MEVGFNVLDNSSKLEAWIKKAQLGDIDAFEKIYIDCHKRIFLLAKRMTNSIADAEDIVQETFVKAWQNLSSFRFESQFYSWIRSISTRIMIDRLRKKNAKVWQDSTDYQEIFESINSNVGQVKDLEKMISLLPSGARSVFLLHDVEGYKHQEIAEMTGVAIGTSKAQLSRARKLLRNSLDDD